MPVHIHTEIVDDSNAHKGQKSRIDQRRPDAAYYKIIGDQEIRLHDNTDNARNDLPDRLDDQSHQYEIDRDHTQQAEFLLSCQGSQFVKMLHMFHALRLPHDALLL